MHGRGRGAAGPLGRGRPMPNKQNLRVVECKPQPCVVSVEGLSSSTTDAQLRGLLTSVGPIQVGRPALGVSALCPAPSHLGSCAVWVTAREGVRVRRKGLPCAPAVRTCASELGYSEVFRCSLVNFVESLFHQNR